MTAKTRLLRLNRAGTRIAEGSSWAGRGAGWGAGRGECGPRPGECMVSRLIVAAAIALVAGCSAGAEGREKVTATVRTSVGAAARPAFVTADAEGKKLWKLTRQFYERREFAPAWINGTKPRDELDQLVTALKSASHEGLDPEMY